MGVFFYVFRSPLSRFQDSCRLATLGVKKKRGKGEKMKKVREKSIG